MTDLEARADRVATIATGNHGRVIGRNGDTMEIEVAADFE